MTQVIGPILETCRIMTTYLVAEKDQKQLDRIAVVIV